MGTRARKEKVNLVGLSKTDYKGQPTTLCKGCGHNSIASQIMVMQAGRSIIQGTPECVRTNQQVQDMLLVLRSGSLKAPMVLMEQRIIGPSLGADSFKGLDERRRYPFPAVRSRNCQIVDIDFAPFLLELLKFIRRQPSHHLVVF